MLSQVRWPRVVIAGFLVEVGLAVTGIPLVPLLGDIVYVTAVPVLCVVIPFLIAWLATRKVPSARVLHGLLIGVVATVLYFALVISVSSVAEASATYGLPLFILVNALRVGSATAGGFLAERQRQLQPTNA